MFKRSFHDYKVDNHVKIRWTYRKATSKTIMDQREMNEIVILFFLFRLISMLINFART